MRVVILLYRLSVGMKCCSLLKKTRAGESCCRLLPSAETQAAACQLRPGPYKRVKLSIQSILKMNLGQALPRCCSV